LRHGRERDPFLVPLTASDALVSGTQRMIGTALVELVQAKAH
jgi:hypothetical protein